MDFNFKSPKEMDFTGNIEQNWKNWKQRLSFFLLATGKSKDTDEAKIAILITLIGDDGLNVYNTFDPKKINDGDKPVFAKVIEAFDNYCNGKKNVVFERHMFLKYNRQEGQSIINYVTKLKLLSATCEYGQLENSVIRDQVVLNTSDPQLQERLISMDDLTLEKAIEIIKQSENVKEQVKLINRQSDSSSLEQPHVDFIQKRHSYNKSKGKKVISNQSELFKCNRCGTLHEKKNCPAFGADCRACGKSNHFAVVCRSNKKVQEVSNEYVHTVDDKDDTFTNQLYGVNEVNIAEIHNLQKPWFKEIKVENQLYVNFKLDTGSQVNLLPLKVYKLLNLDVAIESSTIKLEAYGGFKIIPLGAVKLTCSVNNISAVVTFLVINNSSIPILSLEACVKFKLIKKLENYVHNIVNCVSGSTNNEQNNFVSKNIHIFTGMGTFPGEHKIKINDNAPGSIKPPRRLPQTLSSDVEKELIKLVKSGIISKVDEPKEWSSNLVVIRKPDKSIRICIDPSDLNKALKRENYLIPTFDEIRAKLINKKIFTVLDIKKGFWHVKLDKKSSDLCTFSSPFGYFKFNRLPFGIATAPEIFIKLNQKCFGDIDPNNIIIYFDDILIATKDELTHDHVLKKLTERAKSMNIKFNLDKLQYKKKEIKYIGHIFNESGVSPDPEQVKAIVNLKNPSNKVELQRLIGMFNYLRDFIPNMSSIICPLRELLKKDVIWSWGQRHTEALNELKSCVSNPPVLTHFSPDKVITIQCDASKNGLGCCLLQEKKPIAFASRCLSEAETAYAQIEKEFLSLIFACRKFHYYIFGRKINALTDHKPLVAIMQKDINKIPSNRLQKMRLKLLDYDINLQYLPGKKMLIADLLSRDFCPESYPNEFESIGTVHCLNRFNNNTFCDIKKQTELDPVLSKLIEFYFTGWPNKPPLDNSLKLYYNMKNDLVVNEGILYLGDKIIIPYKLRPFILKLLHESHLGITKTKMRAKQIVFWPGMLNEIEQFIGNCNTCNKFSNSNKKNSLIPHEIPSYPYEKVGADILTFAGSDYLVIVDYFSKWFDLIILKYKTAKEVIQKCKQTFSTHGIPRLFIADNMPFNSVEFTSFAKDWNLTLITSSPHYPQSNGLAERSVQTCKKLLNKSLETGIDIESMLLEYRCTPIVSLQASPSELLYSRLLRTKIPLAHSILKPKLQNQVKYKLKQQQIRYKANYDKSVVTKEPDFKPGSNVLVQKNKMWFPGEIITKAPTPRSYIVRNKKGNIIRRNIRHLKNIKNVTGNLLTHPSNHNEETLAQENRKDSLIIEPKRPKRTIKKPSALNEFILY
uniref:RNA-directed DNA polymerase n=1 Tax=Schizaphis graminum TaxID=13262 RepID=A0A2S2NI46_SCHGA